VPQTAGVAGQSTGGLPGHFEPDRVELQNTRAWRVGGSDLPARQKTISYWTLASQFTSPTVSS